MYRIAGDCSLASLHTDMQQQMQNLLITDYDWGVVAKAELLRHDSDEFASWSMGAIANERLRIHKPKPTCAAELRVPSYVVFVWLSTQMIWPPTPSGAVAQMACLLATILQIFVQNSHLLNKRCLRSLQFDIFAVHCVAVLVSLIRHSDLETQWLVELASTFVKPDTRSTGRPADESIQARIASYYVPSEITRIDQHLGSQQSFICSVLYLKAHIVR
jgi:hypothetical protein